jgi:hypothetical protein
LSGEFYLKFTETLSPGDIYRLLTILAESVQVKDLGGYLHLLDDLNVGAVKQFLLEIGGGEWFNR